MIEPLGYARFLEGEYLSTYVAGGGSAVKFVVPQSDTDAADLGFALGDAAERSGFQLVRVDAAVTKVQLMDQLFFAISRTIDWDALAARVVADTYRELRIPDGVELDLASAALRAQYDEAELAREVNHRLQQSILKDYELAKEFRIAMVRLCQAQLRSGPADEGEHQAVLWWLRGDLRQISLLKSALLFRKIARHNARHMLFSLCRWVHAHGATGLLVEIDIRRLSTARRPAGAEGVYYSKAALLDTYELLRQLVDNTDELAHCCVVVVAAPEFLTDSGRGLDAYQALKLRIFDDVRDRTRENPSSSLVRLGVAS